MKPLFPVKYMLPVGLLVISASLILSHFVKMPDFVDGALKGVGIGVIFLSLIKSKALKKAEQ